MDNYIHQEEQKSKGFFCSNDISAENQRVKMSQAHQNLEEENFRCVKGYDQMWERTWQVQK